MLAPLDYDRYRIIDEVVRLPELRILWAEVDGRRVQLVTAPPIPRTGRLTVLRRLAEREALGVEGVCPYLASGVDEQRTWVAFAAPDTPTLTELADAVRMMPSLANPVVAARIVADVAVALREVVKLAPSLPAGGLDDVRVGPDGRVTIGFLGEILPEPRLEEAKMVSEFGRWLERLGGSCTPLHALSAGISSGSIRRVASLAEELEKFVDSQGGVARSAVGAWVRRHGEATPQIAPPALIDDPFHPDPAWARSEQTPAPTRGRYVAPTNPPQSGSGSSSGTVGGVIGGYRLIKRIGNGMMGRVYEAIRLSDDRCVAMKLMLPADDDPDLVGEYRSRFHREVEALARLSHPNIVRILEFGYDDEGWLAMEYVEGSTLAKVLRTAGHLSPIDVVAIARQLCSALGHAHTHGVIHRDLKPGNVILERDDPRRVRLLDFGLAKEWDGTGEMSNDGTLLGTPHYMSPEQCRGEAARVESDIYALGMLMYRMLTGRMPFENERGAAIFIAHLKNPVPMFDSLGLPFELPPGIEAVVRKCLEKQPEERYRSALALDFALRGCLEASPQRVEPAPIQQAVVLARDGLEQFIEWARTEGPKLLAQLRAAVGRGGPRGLLVLLLPGFLLTVLTVGGAASATVAWLVSAATGESEEPIPVDAGDEEGPPNPHSLRSVRVTPIPAADHPPPLDVGPEGQEASPAFKPSRRNPTLSAGVAPRSDGSRRTPAPGPVEDDESTASSGADPAPADPAPDASTSDEPASEPASDSFRLRTNRGIGG